MDKTTLTVTNTVALFEITGAMCGLRNDEYSTKRRRVSWPSTATVTDFTSSSSTVTDKPFPWELRNTARIHRRRQLTQNFGMKNVKCESTYKRWNVFHIFHTIVIFLSHFTRLMHWQALMCHMFKAASTTTKNSSLRYYIAISSIQNLNFKHI